MTAEGPEATPGDRIRRRIVVRGRVQGVGYRAYVAHHATRDDIAGTVRNTPAGDVECVLEGRTDAVLALIEKLRRGPALAEVRGLDVHSEPPAGESHFRVTG